MTPTLYLIIGTAWTALGIQIGFFQIGRAGYFFPLILVWQFLTLVILWPVTVAITLYAIFAILVWGQEEIDMRLW